MRTPALTIFAAISMLHAADLKPDAAISAVTVYADRAEVTRHAKVRLEAGTHVLTFDNLPAATDLNSVRANGTGAFTLVDIRGETIQTVDIPNDKVRQLTDRLRLLERQKEELTRAVQRVATRKEALDKILGRLTSAGKDSPNPDLDPTKWSGFVDYHAGKLAALDEEALALVDKQRDNAKDADQVRRELAELRGSGQRTRNVARVTVEAKGAVDATLNLSYIVSGPYWEPSYDIRANVKAKTLEVAYYGTVRQSTGEDWKGVTLHLSTAQPSVGGREPELDPWFLRRLEPMPIAAAAPSGASGGEQRGRSIATKAKMMNDMRADGFAETSLTGAMKTSEEARARVITSGVAAVFSVERSCDILADNKPARVPLSRDTFPASFRHTCVPKLSPHVYLKAKVINKTELPYLPGPSAIFVDDSFVANANMDLVPAGQEFWSYLGADASVKVERRVLADRTEVSGVFGKKTVGTLRDYVFKVTNGKQAAVELVIWDQIPASNHEDIKVSLQEPKDTKNNPDLKIDDQKRIEWRIDLKAGEKRDVPFRFTVERPEDFIVEGL
jgi:uncharacterized protein (TIGR02231 family)